MTLPSLITRVRSLKGPDREVDGLIATTVGGYVLEKRGNDRKPWYYHERKYRRPTDGWGYDGLERYTASVDAVLDLIGEKLADAEPGLTMEGRSKDTQLWLAWMGTVPNEPDAFAPTPALALLLAFLNAWNTETTHD
ncbi:MAG: hypothetical protein ACK4RV_10475 [Caulobacter sp.]